MDVVGYTFLKAVSQTLEQLLFWEKLDSTLFTLAISFADTKDPIQLFEYLNQILTVSSTRVRWFSTYLYGPSTESKLGYS